MELVIAAIVLAGGIVAGAVVFGRRTVATADGAPDAAFGDGELRQREEQLAPQGGSGTEYSDTDFPELRG